MDPILEIKLYALEKFESRVATTILENYVSIVRVNEDLQILHDLCELGAEMIKRNSNPKSAQE